MQTILSMFPQTASVIQNDGTLHLYANSETLGNKALFLLIGAKAGTYFQQVIRYFISLPTDSVCLAEYNILICDGKEEH